MMSLSELKQEKAYLCVDTLAPVVGCKQHHSSRNLLSSNSTTATDR